MFLCDILYTFKLQFIRWNTLIGDQANDRREMTVCELRSQGFETIC